MERERRALETFVPLHQHKVKLHPDERCVFLVEHSDAGVPLNCVLTQMTAEDVITYFSRDGRDPFSNPLVRWLLEQIQSYDARREVIIGLIFSPTNVLAHVLRKK